MAAPLVKTTDLPVVNSVSANDRVMVIANTGGTPFTATIKKSNLGFSNGGGGGSGVVPVEVEYEGTWIVPTTIVMSPAGGILSMPGNNSITSDLAWVVNVDLDEGENDSGLTGLTFPNLGGTTGDFYINNMRELETLSVPELKIVGDDFEVYDCPNLVVMEFPKLEVAASGFYLEDLNVLNSISFPLLRTVGDGMGVYDHEMVTELDFSSLTTVYGGITLGNMDTLESVEFPALTGIYWSSFYVQDCEVLQSVELPAIEDIEAVYLYYSPNLTTFRFGESLKRFRYNFYSEGVPLDTETVDHVLVTLAGLDGSNGTTVYEGRSIYLRDDTGYPSANGMAAISILDERGVYVEFNNGTPSNIEIPDISGILQVGQTLSAMTGVWDDKGSSITSYTYAWHLNSEVPETGADNQTYVIQPEDLGKVISVAVRAVNSRGSSDMVYSPTLGPIESAG